MLLVRKSWLTRRALPLPLTLCRAANLLLHRSARYSGSALGLRSHLLARRPLQFLSFRPILNVFRVHQSLFNPAYFSINFLSPYPGKLTVSLASSPSPSRLTIVPLPYFGCSTVVPVFRGGCGFDAGAGTFGPSGT